MADRYPTQSTPVDWSKPIQFANGERAEFIRTMPDGMREVLRPGSDHPTARFWKMPVGSMGHRMGWWIINVPEAKGDG